ncbi:MAG: helix-hairpin-helix domain-containing protein, partial [Clostridia bacterium]|nr:helix-hairpin-helix domain-containing protein [Clostridia bacterium]
FEPLEEISTALTETAINENNGKLDINTATKEELDSLDGIGPVLAERIIEFRKHKPFKTIYDLKKVSGIGDKKFKDIEEYITVNR